MSAVLSVVTGTVALVQGGYTFIDSTTFIGGSVLIAGTFIVMLLGVRTMIGFIPGMRRRRRR